MTSVVRRQQYVRASSSVGGGDGGGGAAGALQRLNGSMCALGAAAGRQFRCATKRPPGRRFSCRVKATSAMGASGCPMCRVCVVRRWGRGGSVAMLVRCGALSCAPSNARRPTCVLMRVLPLEGTCAPLTFTPHPLRKTVRTAMATFRSDHPLRRPYKAVSARRHPLTTLTPPPPVTP